MATQADVEYWLLEYACRFHHHQVIQAVCRRSESSLSDSGVSSVTIALPALSDIVTQERLGQFDLAVRLVEILHEAAGDVVPFRLVARLASALKVKALFHQLVSGHDDILENLNKYFPRSGVQCPTASKKTLSQLNASQSEFRKFFLPLLANERQRKAYLRDEYPVEFGPEFMAHCKKLTNQFVAIIENHLPPTTLEKLMSAIADGVDVDSKLKETGAQSPWTEIVLEAVTGQSHLTTPALLDLLTMVSPVDSHDRVVSLAHSLLTDIMDSDDSGTDQSPPIAEVWLKGEVTKSLIYPDLARLGSTRMDKNTLFNDLSSSKMSAANNTAVSLCVKEKNRAGLGGCAKEVTLCEGQGSERAGDLPSNLVSAGDLTGENTDLVKNRASCSKHKRKTSKHRWEESWCGVPLTTFKPPTGSDVRPVSVRTCNSVQRPPLSRRRTKTKNRQDHSPVKRKSADQSGRVDTSCTRVSGKARTLGVDGSNDYRKRRQSPSKKSYRSSKKSKNTKTYLDESLSDSDVIILSEEDSSDDIWQQSDVSSVPEGSGSISNIDRSTTDSERDISEILSDSSALDYQTVQSSNSEETAVSEEMRLTERDIHCQLISPYRKCPLLKLCVVKLFKNKRWRVSSDRDGEELDIYS